VKYFGYQSRSLNTLRNSQYIGHIIANELGETLSDLGYTYGSRSFFYLQNHLFLSLMSMPKEEMVSPSEPQLLILQ